MRRTLVTFDIWKEILNRLGSIKIERVLVESDDVFVFVIDDCIDVFEMIERALEGSDLRIVKDSLGKPRLFDHNSVERHGISWSYSNGKVLIGLRRNGAIGVDLEVKDISINEADITWVFHENEMSNVRKYGLFDTWVRKEAYVKMLGIGLVNDIMEIDTSNVEMMSGMFLTYGYDFYWSICLG